MPSIKPAKLVRETYQCVVESSEKLYRPFMLLLHSQLVDALEPQRRIAVLTDICDHHVDYLLPFGLPDSELGNIYLECKSLIHYNEILISLLEKPANRSTLYINRELPRPKLEQYIYMQSLRDLDIRHYMAFIQAYALYYRKHQEHPDLFIPTLSFAMLQTWNCLDQMYSKDIISFCKHLYMGESVRQHEIGLLGDNECLNIRTLEVAFRNRCFDEYIRIRLKTIKTEMDADNDRLYPPTELDYMQELLQEESAIVSREQMLEEHFPNSQAFHDQNYRGRHDVMRMAGYFVRYLSDKINHPAASQSIIPPSSPMPTHIYHGNAQHIDNSRTIHIDGSIPNLEGFLRDFMKDEPAPQPVSCNTQPQATTPYPFIQNKDKAEDIIALLRKYMTGIDHSKPKDLMMPVRAAFDAGVIRKPTYGEFKQALPDLAPKNCSSFDKYLRSDSITPHPYDTIPAFTEMVTAFRAFV